MSVPLLLTGFLPFAGEALNPSALVATALSGLHVGPYQIHSALLPVSFADAPRELRAQLRRVRPQAVVALGQAGGRSAIGLERVAINLIDARIPDETGAQPIDQPVQPGAPAARFSTAPLKHLLAQARAAGWPVELSLSAGTFVCNALYFALLQQLRRSQGPCPAVFIHLPWLPEQAQGRGPALALDVQTAVIRGLLAELAHSAEDSPAISGGREH